MSFKTPLGKLKRKPIQKLQKRGLIFMVAFAVIGGAILLIVSHAASPYANLSADKGSQASGAQTIADTNASDGNAVKFGQGTVATVNPPASWTNVTGNLAGTASACGNLSMLSAVPNSNNIIAGVNPPNNGNGSTPSSPGGLYSSTGGASWIHLGTSGTEAIVSAPSWITYDPSNNATFWESGIYGPGTGIYATVDAGNSFHHISANPAYHFDSIAVDYTNDDPVPRKIMVAGGHERTQWVYKTIDGGNTWTNIGANVPAGNGFTQGVVVINASTYVVNTNTSFSGGAPGIWRTTDGGTSWTKVSSQDATEVPLVASNGTIYWAVGNGLIKSTDAGVTWTLVGSGLQYGFHPVELPNGWLASSNYGKVVVSKDGGNNWTAFGANFPYQPNGLIYSANNNAFYIWHNDCPTLSVLPDAIQKGQ